MKKFLLILAFIIFPLKSFAINDFIDVGIAKYAVLEVLEDNTPLRQKDDENAKRLTHLFKGIVLFADKENKDYFRVELKEGEYAYINKKFVEVQAIIPQKRFEAVEKISFKEEKDKYVTKIEIPQISAFIAEEGEQNLNFTLFDSHFDPSEIQIPNDTDNFKFDKQIENELNIKYKSKNPLFGYWIEKTNKGINFIVKKAPKINKSKPLKNIVIAVDPGHGGDDFGACANNLKEKDINLEIAKKLRKELKKGGAKVYLTRRKDKKIPLYERPLFAKEKKADILLSIHQNSLPNPKDAVYKHGVGTYYHNKQSYPLAKKIQENLLLKTGFRDDKINKRSFVLTRPTDCISVLVECGYIIHKDEAQKISDKKFQKVIAKAITQGVKDYLIENF